MKKILFILISISLANCQTKKAEEYTVDEALFLTYKLNLETQNLAFYLKKNDSTNFSNFKVLKDHIEEEKKTLVFAVNGGMFNKQYQPQGLYIENGKTTTQIDTLTNGYGNFYLQPNGIFYITESKEAKICRTIDFTNSSTIEYATQSGPMLVINDSIHPELKKGSKNLNIRNGVGILPDGDILFAMSKNKINFFDFATFFKQNGCKNALYLDGFVSKTYLPSKNYNELEGNFGVIIAETKKKLK